MNMKNGVRFHFLLRHLGTIAITVSGFFGVHSLYHPFLSYSSSFSVSWYLHLVFCYMDNFFSLDDKIDNTTGLKTVSIGHNVKEQAEIQDVCCFLSDLVLH